MAVSTVKYTFNGNTYDLTYDSSTGTYKATITAPSTTSWGQTNHKYAGSVTVTDTAGNSTTKTSTDFSVLDVRVLEKTAPTFTTSSPSSGAYVTTVTPTITWTLTDTGSGVDASTVKLTIDTTAYTTSTNPAISVVSSSGGVYKYSFTPTTSLSNGSHTLKFDASDNDGNAMTQQSYNVTVDTVAPTLNITAPTNNLVTNNATCTVSGSTSDTTAGLKSLTVNGSEVEVASGSFSTTVTLSAGSNTITIIATDKAGKTTTVTRTVTLDQTPPTITAVTLTPNPVDCGATFIITVTCSD